MTKQHTFFDQFAEDLIVPSTREKLGFTTATDADLAKLTEQKRQVLAALHNQWQTAKTLTRLTGATEATRRLRELRDQGFEIIRQGNGRLHYYKWTGRFKEDG